ncbi:MAG TPA: DMT family transporter [Pseudonocardiaceae bacterium]|nr:DMT family transporter [Pseudonocardiaceae bacterium]
MSAATRGAGTAVAVGLGLAVAVQARINGELGQRIDDGVVAAGLSFLSGLLLLTAAAATRSRMRHGLARVVAAVRDRRLHPSQLLGGLCGAFLVTCQGLTVAIIGVAVFTVALVAGQATTSLVVDRAGIGPGGPRGVNGRRVAGAILALAAVMLAVSDRLGAPHALWLALLPALAGVGAAWQQAVNGLVGAAAQGDGPATSGMLPAALVNFMVGTVALALVTAVDIAIRGLPEPLPTQPWLYLGGALGVLFVGAAAAIVPITGVLLLGLGAMAGQLVGAVVLDLFLPAGDNRLTVTTLIGTALTLVAVTVIALPGRERTGRSQA